MKILIFAILSFLIAAGCQNERQEPSQRSALETLSVSGIVGGLLVPADSLIAKSTVGLLLTGQEADNATSEPSLCSATLIAPSLAVTAAHCVSYFAKGWVVFSTHFEDLAEDQRRLILKVRIHPKYLLDQPENSQAFETAIENQSWNDIAVVQFEGVAPDNYQPVELLKEKSALVPELELTLAGYGMTSEQGLESHHPDRGALRSVVLPLSHARYQGDDLYFDRSADGASICNGDSGGSVYRVLDGRLQLVGVISRAEGKQCNSFSVATSVADQADFLQQTLKSLQK